MERIGLFLAVVAIFILPALQAIPADQTFFKTDFQKWAKQKPGGEISAEGQNQGGSILLSGDCTDYIDLTGNILPFSVGGSTFGATNNYGPFSSRPLCWSESIYYPPAAAAPDVTYKWTAPEQGRYRISLIGSGYDTVLLLYDFTCPFEPIYPIDFICGNDDFSGLQSQLSYVPLDEGQEVLIVVDGYSSNAGLFILTISRVQTSPVDSFMVDIMNEYPIPGMQACVVKDGNVIWTGAYGESYIGLRSVTDSTVFSLASVSKTVIGAALMQLYEGGHIDLDRNVNDYLQSFSVVNPNFPASPITARMLAAHTSSINDRYNIFISVTVPGDSPILLGQFLEDYLSPGGAYYNPALNFTQRAPGDSVRYSNVGASLAAYLIEILNPDSVSFAQFCEQNIFDPLGMDETGWFFADFTDSMNIAMPYDRVGGNYIPWGHYGQPHYPAVQLRSSSLQMARFLTAIMQYGILDTVRILDSASVALMNTIQYPLVPGMNHPGQAGIGWFYMDLFNKSFWGHLGRWHGVMTGMYYCPAENTGVIVLTNEDFILDQNPPFPDENMFAIYELFEFASGGISCNYTVGDVNASDSYNGLDITYGVAFFKGGPAPMCPECALCPDWWYCGDVNGSCSYNGLDITYGVAYLKGGYAPVPCAHCPPAG